MPRSVRVAILASSLIALVGAGSAAIWIADAAATGAGTAWLSSLSLAPWAANAMERAGSPLYLLAVAIVPIVARRDARSVRIAFQLALLAAIALGVTASGLVGASVASRRLDPGLAAMLLVLALIGLLAASLSRPSARAWFASR